MAEENQNKYEESNTTFDSENSEIKDRGVFDFLGGKKKEEDHTHQQEDHTHQQEDVIATEFDHKVTLSDQLAETKKEEDQVEVEGEKKHNIFEKLHRSGSSSSSSSEEEGEDGEKKKKKKKEKKKVVEEDNSVEVEKVEVVEVTAAAQPTEEKKGFLEKIKDKLPGHKKTEDVTETTTTTTPTIHDESEDAVKEKKGILEKIKEKLPGYHPKTTTELDDKDHHKDDTTTSH